jgi:NADP-dependent 3-hydroxy acid dehydrogenase YdfG
MTVALINGGASFIACGIAKQLIDESWRIVLADIDKEGMEKVAAELAGANAVGMEVLDVTDLDAVAAAVARLSRPSVLLMTW